MVACVGVVHGMGCYRLLNVTSLCSPRMIYHPPPPWGLWFRPSLKVRSLPMGLLEGSQDELILDRGSPTSSDRGLIRDRRGDAHTEEKPQEDRASSPSCFPSARTPGDGQVGERDPRAASGTAERLDSKETGLWCPVQGGWGDAHLLRVGGITALQNKRGKRWVSAAVPRQTPLFKPF